MHRCDLTRLAAISEAHYSDLYGEAMRRFHEKYKNAGPDLWVNFNPVLSDPRDKTIVGLQADRREKNITQYHFGDPKLYDAVKPIFKKPDHGDPVGTYVYPAEYVANHWFDINYGDDMQYLRVIKTKDVPPEKTLRLSDMTREEFLAAAKRLRLEWSVAGKIFSLVNSKDAMVIYEAVLEDLIQTSPRYRINPYGKVLFALVQRIYGFMPNPDAGEDLGFDDEGEGQYRYDGQLITKPAAEKDRTQQQQNRLLVEAGYDMVVDQAKTPLQATIFDAEPEQAIFLTKRSYDVVEVFKLPPNRTVMTLQKSDITTIPKVFAGLIAKSLGDRISEVIPFGDIGFEFNVERFRRWLKTDQLEMVKMDPRDPTQPMANYDLRGYTTQKGRLIITTTEQGTKSDVRNDERHKEALADVSRALVRGGENDRKVKTDLRSFFISQIDKQAHRNNPDYTPLALHFAVIGGPNQVVYGKTGFDTKLPQAASAVTAEFKAIPATPSRRITAALVKRYEYQLAHMSAEGTLPVKKLPKPVASPMKPAPSYLGNVTDLPEAP